MTVEAKWNEAMHLVRAKERVVPGAGGGAEPQSEPGGEEGEQPVAGQGPRASRPMQWKPFGGLDVGDELATIAGILRYVIMICKSQERICVWNPLISVAIFRVGNGLQMLETI